MKEWHYTIAGRQVGPVTKEDIAGRLAAGEITTDTLVWKAGQAQWQPLRMFPELLPAPAFPPPPAVSTVPVPPPPVAPFPAMPPMAPAPSRFPLWLKVVFGLIGLGVVGFIVIFILIFVFVFSAAKELGVTPGNSGSSSAPSLAGLIDVDATARAAGVPVAYLPASTGSFQRGFVKTFQKNGSTGISVGYQDGSRSAQIKILNGRSAEGAGQIREAFEAEYAGDATFKEGGPPFHLLKGFSRAQNAYVIIWTQGAYAFCARLPDKESAQDFLLPYLQANLGQSEE